MSSSSSSDENTKDAANVTAKSQQQSPPKRRRIIVANDEEEMEEELDQLAAEGNLENETRIRASEEEQPNRSDDESIDSNPDALQGARSFCVANDISCFLLAIVLARIILM